MLEIGATSKTVSPLTKEDYKRNLARIRSKSKRVSPETGRRITQIAQGLEGLRQEGQSWRKPLPPNWANNPNRYA